MPISASPSRAASMLVPVLRARAGFLGAFAMLGVAISAAGEGSAPSDVDELAVRMGQAAGGHVRPEDIRWEPSRGWLADVVLGRFALFLASEAEGGPRDVYRARVRVSPEGRPLGVASVRNLTSTPLGDDHALVVRGTHAAYATFAFGQEQSVTVLDLAGEGAQNTTTKLYDRAMAWVTNVQQTGAGEGIGRVDLTLDQPAKRVGLALDEGVLAIDLSDDDRGVRPTRQARFDLARSEIAVMAAGMHAEAGRHLPKPIVFWAVDTVRAVPWIGPAPIAWLEERTFAVRDVLRRVLFKASGGGEVLAKAPEQESAPVSVLDGAQAGADLGHWPPPAIRSIWKTPEPGEGEWETPKQPWIKRLPTPAGCEGASATACELPSPFYRTFVRSDEERPYTKVLLVAMDMRQLDLGMEAGSEDPKPLTGPPGTGRLPRDPAISTRVAAAFNGGFKTEHGTYGMMVNRRVLLPPMPGAATVIVTKDGRVGMGSWGTNKDVSGIVDVEPGEIVSFRQNLDPLVDSDKVNPLGRALWGFTLPGTSMQTERSGICVTSAGHLLYAWGDDVSATTLGKAMKMAGCIYGMHLDMNPHHTGFIFTNITEFKGRNYKSELLSKDMEIMPDRYIEYAPKDFFYVMIHDPTPPAIEGAGVNGKAWEPDPGVQPAPAWMAGVWRTSTTSGGVSLLAVEPARASFRVRAGTREPDAKTGVARAHELDADDAHRVLFALTLGIGTDRRPKGLVTDGKVALPLTKGDHLGALVATDDGQLSITRAAELDAVPAGADVVELPMLLEDGKLVAQAHAGHAPAALGVTTAGRVVVARGEATASAEDVANALRRAGCARAVLLDRGAGGHGALFRAGTSSPPRSRYDDTTLYAMGKALVPRGFRFEPMHPVEPPAPKTK